MAGSYDLQHGPLVLVQQRGKLTLALVSSLAFVVIGFWLLHQPGAGLRGEVAGILAIGFFGALAARAVAAILRPNQLTIEERGLTLRTPFRSRFWAWSDLDHIQLYRVRRTDVITFHSRTAPSTADAFYRTLGLPGNSGLPGGWPIDAQALLGLLTDAKSRWDKTVARPTT
jgi:hypothetical protein